MKSLFTSLVLVFGCLLITCGCTSENEQYKPTPDKEPQVPTTDNRDGPAESFLPPQPEG